jgi:hypothetical protein
MPLSAGAPLPDVHGYECASCDLPRGNGICVPSGRIARRYSFVDAWKRAPGATPDAVATAPEKNETVKNAAKASEAFHSF